MLATISSRITWLKFPIVYSNSVFCICSNWRLLFPVVNQLYEKYWTASCKQW